MPGHRHIARCQNREEHSPLAIHTAEFVHVLVLLAEGFALCYGESNNLTVIVKQSLARASKFERSQRSRAGRVLKLFENRVLPGVLMYVHWRHFTHTKFRKARRTWSPSVGEYVSDGRFAPSPREARHTVYMNTASKLGPHTQTVRGTCPGMGLLVYYTSR